MKKFQGKAAWTYAEIPEAPPDKNAPFGWVKVKGSIDGHSFAHYKLMPMKNGSLFFPVKASIRKKIKKEAGDTVRIVLYADHSKLEIPRELEECLKAEPDAYAQFTALKEGTQKEFIDWIYSAKRIETRVERIVKTIELVLKKQTLHTRVKDL